MPNINECEFAGIDPQVVSRFEKRLTRLLKEMAMHDLSLFCGSICTIRYTDDRDKGDLIVGHAFGGNIDGGAGDCTEDDNGLLRGE